MHNNHQSERGIVRYIIDITTDESARSLTLLRAIENTVRVNETLCDSYVQITNRLIKATEDVCRNDALKDVVIDDDGGMRTLLESTLDDLQRAIEDMRRRRSYAIQDRNLRDDDGVVESFDKAIEAMSDAFAVFNDVNWAIMEHDADLAPRSENGPFKSVDDLLTSLFG